MSSKKGSREAVHIGQGDFCGKYDEVTVALNQLVFSYSCCSQLLEILKIFLTMSGSFVLMF